MWPGVVPCLGCDGRLRRRTGEVARHTRRQRRQHDDQRSAGRLLSEACLYGLVEPSNTVRSRRERVRRALSWVHPSRLLSRAHNTRSFGSTCPEMSATSLSDRGPAFALHRVPGFLSVRLGRAQLCSAGQVTLRLLLSPRRAAPSACSPASANAHAELACRLLRLRNAGRSSAVLLAPRNPRRNALPAAASLLLAPRYAFCCATGLPACT